MRLDATRAPRKEAFTLVELLLVITIIGLMLALTGPALRSSMQSQNLAATARQLSGDLEQAALLARKENRPVEVMLYKFAPADSPGDAAFRAYQFGILEGFKDDGAPQYRFLVEPRRFSQGVILSPKPEYSTLLAGGEKPVPEGGGGVPETSTFVSYQIRPDGSTTLDRDERHALTLIMEKDAGADALPPDFRTVLINPVTARARVY